MPTNNTNVTPGVGLKVSSGSTNLQTVPTGRKLVSIITANAGEKKGVLEYVDDMSKTKGGVVRLLTKVQLPLRLPPQDSTQNSCCCAPTADVEDHITAHAVLTIPAKYAKMLTKGIASDTGLSVPAQTAAAALVLADLLVGKYSKPYAPSGAGSVGSAMNWHHALATATVALKSNGDGYEAAASTPVKWRTTVTSRSLSSTGTP
uniref:Uncharacterized protein n=1 Tax=Leviviridae sp. TaxID=2027243 RepID=A0A142D849_9VIRU|nr:hypothetical protein [Leviviridae sp.]